MVTKNALRTIISQWIQIELPFTIPRKVKIPTDLPVIISILGPRRAGKTFLMYDTIKEILKVAPKENVLYVNFENESLLGLEVIQLNDLLTIFRELSHPRSNYPVYLFLDEIQVVENWSKWVNRLYENKGFRLFISGSSSKLLSSELSTELRGRSIDFVILPLSFREFLSVKNVEVPNNQSILFSEKRGEYLSFLTEYVKYGGFPEVVLMNAFKGSVLKSYLDTTVIKDVGERFKIEPSVLKVFVYYCLKSYTKQISGMKVYNYLKTLHYSVSHDLPLKLVEAFTEVFFLHTTEIYSSSFKNAAQYPKKLYLVDTGAVNEITQQVEIGKCMENVTFQHLFGLVHEEGIIVNYWKEYGKAEGLEVDFVISDTNGVRELINVTYASSLEEINAREIKSLKKASRELKCNNLTILTWDYFETGEIKYIPLWYWLLNNQTFKNIQIN